jgi:hypothetical protein
MKYLESSMFFSLNPGCAASSEISYIYRAGIFIYTIIMLVMWKFSMVTYPGNGINDSSD